MFLSRFRGNYWSCSEFADWVRRKFGGIEKPLAATMEEWDQYKVDAQAKSKVVYWLTGDGLTILQNIVYFPYDVLDAVRYYFVTRFITKPHMVPTRLEPYVYHETDTRLFHGAFELLVDFIEIEKAWMAVVFDSKGEEWEKYGYPRWYRYRLLRWTRKFRSPEAGLAHLEWEMSLDNDGPEGCPSQAAAAREQLAIYKWWKTERPARVEPYDVKGLTYEQRHEMEEKYFQEDDEMFIRLIKVRRSLWT
jgi:hypothetical protein